MPGDVPEEPEPEAEHLLEIFADSDGARDECIMFVHVLGWKLVPLQQLSKQKQQRRQSLKSKQSAEESGTQAAAELTSTIEELQSEILCLRDIIKMKEADIIDLRKKHLREPKVIVKRPSAS